MKLNFFHACMTIVFAVVCVIASRHSIAQSAVKANDVSATKVIPSPPNVILILADDLGFGELGCYGQMLIKTPQIDRLARDGMRFSDFYAGSTVCAPSRCVLMTGLHTGHATVRGNVAATQRHLQSLKTSDWTIPKMLSARGYETAMIGKWGLGELDQPGRPLLQGFDSYFGYLNQVHAHNYFPTTLIENDQVVTLNNPTTLMKPDEGDDGGGYLNVKELSPAQLLTSQYTPDLFVQKSIEFINKDHQKPFFLYLPLTLPHANNELSRATGNGAEILSSGVYENPEWTEADRKHAAMISKLDEGVGAILDHLKRVGLDKNTLVLLTSDNGPQKESGHRPEFFESSGPLNGMKRSLTDGGIRVPMIASWPGHIPANTVSEHIGYSGDLMATLAELTETKATGSDLPVNLDSISILPTLTQSQLSTDLTPIADYFQQFGKDQVLMAQSPNQKLHEYLYWEFYEQGSRAAVRFNQWKLIEEPMFSGKLVLYDLSSDLNESTNVSEKFPDVAAIGRKYLREGHRESPDWVVTPLRK